jgi:hypothetical protein
MGKIVTSLIVLGFLALGIPTSPSLCAEDKEAKDADKEKKPAPKFTVAKETTYVSGTLDKDGYIDYEAALNDQLAKGITPATNANVLLWKAIGPRPEGAAMLPEYFRRLGIEAPPEGGKYFVGLGAYAKDVLKLPAGPPTTELLNQMDQASQRPWAAKDLGNIASWLDANEKPLALLIEATKRPEYYNPLVTRHTDKGPGGLIGALLPSVQKCRELASALTIRAMLRVNDCKFDEAWQDLLACHRLGRLLARGGCLIESLVGIAINQIACNADLAFLERAGLSAQKAQACLRDLQQLPPLAPVADRVNLLERFTYLESVMMLHRHGIGYLEGLASVQPPKHPDPKFQRVLDNLDWDPALKTGNRWYDRLSTAMRIKDRPERKKQLDQIEEDLKALKKKLAASNLAEVLAGAKEPDKETSQKLGDILVCLLVPAVSKVQQAADRTGQTQQNVHVAFALAAYRAKEDRYPPTLDALAPKYLERVPGDLFSGKGLIYRRTETGYLLYSVGVNGKDDGGHGPEDEPAGDDLRVRMPLPERKQK